jgi:hypothetical protein
MSFGLIGGSSFGRPTIGWNNSSSMNRSNRKHESHKRSAGRMGGKNFHQLPGSPMYSGGAPKQNERVNYGPRDASMSAKGSFSDNTKATRLHKFDKSKSGGGKSMTKNFKSRGKYSSHGGGGNNNNGTRSSLTFGKAVNRGISRLDLPINQDMMGGGAHLQSLEYPTSIYDSSKFFVKNIALKPTGLNLPESDIFKFFSTRIFPAYLDMLQKSVNYRLQITTTEFQQWFYNIQNALNLWFYVNSILSFYDNNPSANEGMSSMRTNISSESLNLYDQLGKLLEERIMDPAMVNLIRYFNDVYQVSSTNPQSGLIKFSYESTMGEDSSQLENSLETAIINLNNIDLMKINTVMRQAKPEWAVKLNPYDGRAKHDENFMTFWANIPEAFSYDGERYMQPYLEAEGGSYQQGAHFGIYGNDYSIILSGLTCFNVSEDGTIGTVHSGFIQPITFGTTNTSNLRWDTLQGGFVPAGYASTTAKQFDAIMGTASNNVIKFDDNGVVNTETHSALKPQCQEPITMNVLSTRQDFNEAMEMLFTYTSLNK